MTRGKSKKISNFEFRIMRHLRKHQDRWFTTTQLSRRLRVGYAITGIILRKFKKDGKIISVPDKEIPFSEFGKNKLTKYLFGDYAKDFGKR